MAKPLDFWSFALWVKPVSRTRKWAPKSIKRCLAKKRNPHGAIRHIRVK